MLSQLLHEMHWAELGLPAIRTSLLSYLQLGQGLLVTE